MGDADRWDKLSMMTDLTSCVCSKWWQRTAVNARLANKPHKIQIRFKQHKCFFQEIGPIPGPTWYICHCFWSMFPTYATVPMQAKVSYKYHKYALSYQQKESSVLNPVWPLRLQVLSTKSWHGTDKCQVLQGWVYTLSFKYIVVSKLISLCELIVWSTK